VTPKEALARYFEQQSKWRQQRAAEHPDDARNQRSAAALGELVGGHEKLPVGGQLAARWWPTKVPTGGQVFCPR
jgi:hypothetical protein